MQNINHLTSALIMAAMTAGFASCSSSDEPSSVSDNTPKELTLTIMSTKPVTKAELTSEPTDRNEKKINRITVGIFSSDGTKVRTIQEFSDGSALNASDVDGTKFYNDGNGSATVKVITTNMVAGDMVAIAINAPTNRFKGVMTLSNFKAKTMDAEEAIATDKDGQLQTSPQATNILMYGEVAAKGSGTSFTANVHVYHLTAKITLSSLSVDFDANGPYADASFTPSEIFLHSVPDGLKFDNTNPFKTTTTYFTGETSTTTGLTVKDFLSSGTITSGTALSTSQSMSGNYFFYTTPNSDDGTNKTRLVIKGLFKNNTSDAGTTVYYPVKLNYTVKDNGTTETPDASNGQFKVYPNKNYVCTVKIKTKGAANADDDIDPTTATIKITVKDWETVSQTTVFQ